MNHITVFRQAASDWLDIQPNKWYLDATLGGGGHTAEILRHGGRVVAFDYDKKAITAAEQTFTSALTNEKLVLINKNFAYLHQEILNLGQFDDHTPFAGILFDLGTNSDQLTSGEKGLSVYQDGPLDMRLDETLAVTAHDLLMALSERELAELFLHYGGELEANRIARAIVTERRRKGQKALQTSNQLATLIGRVKRNHAGKLHPATKVFQALRIAVNDEIGNLERALPQAFDLLASHGRLVTIAFHDGEDRPVKQFFRAQNQNGVATLLTKKPIPADKEEIKHNPRARSAKMRVLEKI